MSTTTRGPIDADLRAALAASTAVLAYLVGDLPLVVAALERIHDRDLPRVIAALGAMRAQCELRRAAGPIVFDPASGRPIAEGAS